MLLHTLLLASSATALLPIVSYGNKFYKVNEDYTKPGTEFHIVGVDYQPGGSSSFDSSSNSDVLSDSNQCMRDAYALQQLGVNSIRVYSVSPWVNHDECMTIFNNAGIYVILDVNNPSLSLTRENTGDSYNSALLNNVFGLIDAFKYYPNTLAFLSGNEIVNDGPSAKSAPPYIRALQRDMKEYIAKHANRTIPVGYSAADVLELRTPMWQYLQCGNDTSRSDFYGINSYEWCSGSSDWQSSGYADIKSSYSNSSIPIFFTEYGCNKNQPRTFDEVTDGVFKHGNDGLYDVVMGGLIYEYSEESSNYGLVEIQNDNSIKYLEDFSNLQKRYASITLTNDTQPSSPDNKPPACSRDILSASGFNFTLDLPSCPDEKALKDGGGNNNVGKLVDISKLTQKYNIYNAGGNKQDGKVNFSPENQKNWQYNVPQTASDSRDSQSSAASSSSSSSSASSSFHSSGTSSSASSSKKKNEATATDVSLLSAAFAVLLCFA